MGDLMSVVGNHTLFDLSLPGTHDSLAHDLCPELDPAQPAWLRWFASLPFAPRLAETHTLSVSDQLDQGVRFLDLRVMPLDGVWRGVHFLATCDPALGYLYSIRNWLNRHPSEILVVWLSEHGEAHLTGEDQFPNVSISEKNFFWTQIMEIFQDISIQPGNLNFTISDLVARNTRILFVVSDYHEFTASSPYAVDASEFLYNDISRDLDLSVSLPLMARAIDQGASRRAYKKFWLMSLAPAIDLIHMHGAVHSMFLKTKLFGDSIGAQLCADAIGVPDMTWCPDSLMEFSRLFNYYAQALVERGLSGQADLPHAFYVDVLGVGGVVKTDRRTRSQRGYALVDKMLIGNVKRLCGDACLSIIAYLKRRANQVGPFRLWEDPKHGRVMGWPGI